MLPTDVRQAHEALNARYADSLSTDDDSTEPGDPLDRSHGQIDDGFGHVEDKATMAALAAQTLTGRERDILRLRFDDDLTQHDIARMMGLSPMQVSRMLRQILDKMHRGVMHSTADTMDSLG
ncbi:hypothetical protein FSW04_24460 [Baekduia soli]|uniref:RNA polymerase sigma-70 region 4 domain-containing protein n=1 Tax=Baekduia soli TaxID=496014 RepID=A0A5B8UBJ0_9ACTN|nr:sigma factor-like helix-turn-helix DNA-binding protein [Baekduia soli]QEC50425.1 hypothetical protein FSW04_24460 [Baekduia soli]